MEVSESLKQWLWHEHHVGAHPLPYGVEEGGLFLKDAAVLAGLGIIGRNNLLVHPQWGPRIRLRSVLIDKDLETPPGVIEGFSPCETCEELCHKACPQNAFYSDRYHRPRCMIQMDADVACAFPTRKTETQRNSTPAIQYCRACELACPVGT
jgi:epoxyqueuosine reductase